LLTGATGGIGRELVRLLAEEGARLILTGRRFSDLERLIHSLPHPESATAIDCELILAGEAERLAREAEAVHGRIDVLINNAGMSYFALAEEATDDNIRKLFELNTFTPLTLARCLIPGMKARGEGRIINISSAAGRVPIPTVSIYGGSKSALALMANTMRLELAPAGITIMNIYPGTVATAFEVNALREKDRPGLDPAGRSGSPPAEMAARIIQASRGSAGEVWLEREGFWMAASSLLWPSLVERRLRSLRDRALAHGEGGKPPGQRRWQLWQVETSMACHLNCTMCPWKEVRAAAGEEALLSVGVWEKLRPHLPEVASVDFSGGGEPLLHGSLCEWIAEARGQGCRAGFLTNGMLLNEEICRDLVAAGTDWIAVSMDGASAEVYESVRPGATFEQVTRNIRQLASLRVQRVPRLAINFVMMPANFHQLEDLIRLARELGVDQVNFKQCDVVRGEHGHGLGLFASREAREQRRYEKTLARARRLARRLGIETTAFSFLPDEQPVCDQDPRSSLFIRHDGYVAPCINQAYGGEVCFLGEKKQMPTVHYGSLEESDLLELWETNLCRRYRDLFQQRVQAHDVKLISTGLGSSLKDLKEAFESAREAMPRPPEGCNHCHYLFDI